MLFGSRGKKTTLDSRRTAWAARGSGGQLDLSGRGHHVESAFLDGLFFPPPAAGAEVLAKRDGAGAGRAADAGIELVVQRVVVDAVHADVVPHVAPRPVRERIALDALFAFVDERDVRARAGAFAPQACDPCALARERALHRLDLADLAAGLAQLDAAVHRVAALA